MIVLLVFGLLMSRHQAIPEQCSRLTDKCKVFSRRSAELLYSYH